MKKIALAALTPMLLLSISVHAMVAKKVDPALCSAVDYQKPPSVDYQPGVDVNGKKVTPADLPNQQKMTLPKKITIPLTASLAKLLNLDTTKDPASKLGPGTEAQLGSFIVEGNQVSFNGKPLTAEQKEKVTAACAK
jgi:hypothetical protein